MKEHYTKGETMLTMIAVDGEGTIVREDAFLVEESPEKGVIKRLRIATILPPPHAVNPDNFLRNLLSLQEERTFYFFNRSKPIGRLGLHETFPKKVLMAVYDMRKNGDFIERLEVDEAIITSMTFAELQSMKGFAEMQSTIEDFLWQYAHIAYTYKLFRKRYQDVGAISRSLVAGMSALFNKTCSYYAANNRISTVRKKQMQISYMVHNGTAIFNAPIRKAEGLVNLERLISHLEGRVPFYTENRLRQFGVSF